VNTGRSLQDDNPEGIRLRMGYLLNDWPFAARCCYGLAMSLFTNRRAFNNRDTVDCSATIHWERNCPFACCFAVG
jgi:hypothetical protein